MIDYIVLLSFHSWISLCCVSYRLYIGPSQSGSSFTLKIYKNEHILFNSKKIGSNHDFALSAKFSEKTMEIPTIVLDIGSHTIKAGLASNGKPDFLIPSVFPLDQHNFPISQEIPGNAELDDLATQGEVINNDRMVFLLVHYSKTFIITYNHQIR